MTDADQSFGAASQARATWATPLARATHPSRTQHTPLPQPQPQPHLRSQSQIEATWTHQPRSLNMNMGGMASGGLLGRAPLQVGGIGGGVVVTKGAVPMRRFPGATSNHSY